MVAVTLLVYCIFKPVNKGLSLVAASCNFVGLTCGALRWNPRGVDIPVVLAGLYCLLIGYLVFRSTFLPRILGALMAFAGLAWVTYPSPPLADHLSPVNLAAGILGQESGMLWFLVMGVNAQRWKEQASGQVTDHPIIHAPKSEKWLSGCAGAVSYSNAECSAANCRVSFLRKAESSTSF
jgi:hypothetical protein